jgi:hypothetical protein
LDRHAGNSDANPDVPHGSAEISESSKTEAAAPIL